MDTNKWRIIKDLFAQAQNLPKQQQTSFIEEHAQGDIEIQSNVMQMLAADTQEQGEVALKDVIASSASDLLLDVQLLNTGDIIERFEVTKSIGEGGMGSVFLGSRKQDDFEQLVAIKVIHRKHITTTSLQRFRRERQILAALNHKNIASFIGGGETEQGQPYIILEYVDGMPITQYCQHHNLTVAQRIELFKQVLEAVTYAHQNLIVHRDIKPNNVLVNERGEVKLLDFGIAKLIQETAEAENPSGELTQEFARVLTPSNASPEQVLGSNITTRSDVYGLGALLMYLLTDEAVFDTTASSQRSIESMIIELEPTRPSTRCLASANDVVKQRAKILKGDLDTIVMKALQKEPERRYSSTEQLMDDIVRHQNNYPILAKPDSMVYRVKKFVQRNTLSTAMGSALAIGIVTSGIIMFAQSNAIEKERDIALQQAFVAQETAQFMTNIFDAANPNNNAGENISVRSIVDVAATNLENLNSEPLIKAQLNTSLASVYAQIGEYDLASTLITNAERYFSELSQSEQQTNGQHLSYILKNEKANLMILLGDYEQALTLFSALADDLAQNPPSQATQNQVDTYYIWSQYGLGTAYSYSGVDEPAVKHYQNAVARSEQLIANNGASADEIKSALPAYYFGLGHSLRRTGQFEQSKRVLQRGIELEKALQRAPSLDLAHGLNQLADTLLTLGELEQAEQYAQEGLTIRRDIHEYGNVEVIASIGVLANIYAKQNQYQRGIDMRTEMLDMLEQAVGKTHPYYASVQHSLGKLYTQIKDFTTAQAYLDDALAGFKRSFPDGHRYVADALVVLGDLALQKGEVKEALNYLSEGLEILAEKAPEPTQLMAMANAYYATALYQDGQTAVATEHESKALSIITNLFGEDSFEYKTLFKRIEGAK